MTPEEFFAWGERQEIRYELVDGFPVKMQAGACNYHDVITVNVIASLGHQLRGSLCRVGTAATAIRTRIASFRRPDVMAYAGQPQPDSYEAGAPRLVVEVLSPSNAGIGWQRKLDEYRRVKGLVYILLIESRSIGAVLFTQHAGETGRPPISTRCPKRSNCPRSAAASTLATSTTD
ncbi:MAG: Uma2 family endonuclease [Hyphomicrobium sp.]